MSMDSTDVKQVHEVKKKSGEVAMRVTVEYFDLDYAKLVSINKTALNGLLAQQDLGEQEARRRAGKSD